MMTKAEIIARLEYLMSDGRSLGSGSWTMEIAKIVKAIAEKLPDEG